ncbi:hypothetical protein [Mycobacterium sp. D16Q16]|uniref:hypothetical protein n=1 Tax=Mycobacterium sp. D16Q16 TaxID=1855659 RepID=UPI00256FCAFE|nr:hypothetical protein [Mycobacterium sp. D16Q16]
MRDAANAKVASYIDNVRGLSNLVALIAVSVAYPPGGLYREPGQSITDIDDRLGSEEDVDDPLLTAHRSAKFYLISAGDCVHSMSTLLSTDHPNFVGAAALARSAAEHASRSMYLSDPSISYQARMLRINLLITDSLREYKSSPVARVTGLINQWKVWRTRMGSEFHSEFKDVPKQKFGNATQLIEKYFPGEGAISYEELSRPTHGNAAWLAITVISEQKQTVVARIMLMRNVMFATRYILAATESVANLWQLDLDAALRRFIGQDGESPSFSWAELVSEVQSLSATVDSFDERQFLDATDDPQPRR